MKLPEPRKLKSGSWNAEIMVGGKRLSYTASTKKECKSWLLKMKSNHVDGRGTVCADKATIGGIMDAYIDSRTNVLSPSTIRGYKMIRKNHWQRIIDKNVNSVRNWQMIVNEEAKQCSPKTLKNSWALLRASLEDVGVSTGKVRLPQITYKEKEFLDPEQIQTLVAAICGCDIEMEILLALHGLRRSELYALRRKHIANGTILIRGSVVPSEQGIVYKGTNKTKASRRDVPIIIPRLQELVDKIQEPEELLCKSSFARSWVKIKRICKENGLPEISLHNLRHSFASLCYHLGISELETMRLGGWSDLTVMRKIYTHLAEADRLAAENKLKGFFLQPRS